MYSILQTMYILYYNVDGKNGRGKSCQRLRRRLRRRAGTNQYSIRISSTETGIQEYHDRLGSRSNVIKKTDSTMNYVYLMINIHAFRDLGTKLAL